MFFGVERRGWILEMFERVEELVGFVGMGCGEGRKVFSLGNCVGGVVFYLSRECRG